MTVKDLYTYAKDLGIEDYHITVGYDTGAASNKISKISCIDDDKKEVEVDTEL